MPMQFIRKLPIPLDTKEKYPISAKAEQQKAINDAEIRNVMSGASDKKLLIIGPCSADYEESVMDYVNRLARIQEDVKDKILIIPRIYTNKPRTTGDGYKGMVHQPNPEASEDMLEGLIAIRRLHTNVLAQTGLSTADDLVYNTNDMPTYSPTVPSWTKDSISFLAEQGFRITDLQV